MVNIKPKGPVPVLALEWQISNEVPNNLKGLKRAAESATAEYIEVSADDLNGWLEREQQTMRGGGYCPSSAVDLV